MKLKAIFGTMALLALACCAQAQNEEAGRCGNEMLKGAWGAQVTGTRPASFIPPGRPGYVGQMEEVIGYVIQTYDGKGNFTQVENIKGTISGYPPNRPGSGTYVVNPDCSVITTIQPVPGVSVVTRGILLDGGKEYRGFTSTPEAINILIIARPIK